MMIAILLSAYLQVAQHGMPLNPSAACDEAKDRAYCAEILPMIDSVDARASAERLQSLIAARGWPAKELVGSSASTVAETVLRRALASPSAGARVARVWRGRVHTSRAGEYERYLDRNGISKIRAVAGNLGAQMMRRDLGDGTTEFVVISYWPSRSAIRVFAGEDIAKVRDLPRDKEFLAGRPTVQHYDMR